MRKPCYYYIFLFAFSFLLFASRLEAQQLKLGNNPTFIQPSAVLQLDSKNQGLLLTRVPDTSAINTFVPPDGMIIYFTDSNKISHINYGPNSGVYERKNGMWQRMLFAGDGSYWSLTGNSGTNPATNFLGTTDNNPLKFRVNNQSAGYLGIADSSTSFGINSSVLTQWTTAIGASSSATNSYATAIGYKSSANSQYSTAIGSKASANNSNSTAVGYLANTNNKQYSTVLGSNTSAANSNTTALGYLSTANGQYSTALGSNSTAGGQSSTALGYQSKASATNATAVGENAYAWNPNTLILGDTINNIKVGIGTNNPSNTLTINSTTGTSGLQLTNLTTGSAVTLGSVAIGVDGSGNVVRVDGVPTYYGSGGPVLVTKVWEGIVSANAGTTYLTNVTTVPINTAGFTNILNVQATPIYNATTPKSNVLVSIISYTTTQVLFVTLIVHSSGPAYNDQTGAQVFIRVEGN